MSKSFWLAVVVVILPIGANAQTGAVVNPAYRRAQTLVNDGNATAGRAIVDSMIAAAAPGSNDYAEGVYWRAVLAATAADAEMDYKRIVVDYPTSPRVEDALIRLAQLEMARANYDGALRHLNQLAVEHPASPERARAAYWMARAKFDKNDLQGGCAATADALQRTTDADTELRNQINYLNQRCADLPAAPAPGSAATAAPPSATQSVPVAVAPAPAPVPGPAPAAATPPVTQPVAPAPTVVPDTMPHRVTTTPAVTKPSPRPVEETPKKTAKASPPAPSGDARHVFSVQVAAYNVKSQAEAMVAKLRKNGYEARVDGTEAPFRVRIGKYATESQATAVQRSLKVKKIEGFVTQADIR